MKRLLAGLAAIICWVGFTSGAEYYLDIANGSDTNPGTLGNPCKTLTKGKSLAESQRTSSEPTTIYLAPGNYGDLVWAVPGDFTSEVTWKSSDSNNPAQITYMSLSSNGAARQAKQTFDNIKFHTPAGTGGMGVIMIGGNDHVTIRNSEVSNEDLYSRYAGIQFSGCNNITIDNTYIHDVVAAIRFKGSNHIITNSRVDRVPGSVFSSLCGGGTTRNITIAYNVVKHPSGDYPSEPGYSSYDEPAELHSSIVAIRGDGFTIDHNIFYNIKETAYIQFYEGDCGVTDYNIKNITVTNNIFYAFEDALGTFHVPGNGRLDGPAVIEHNTIIGAGAGITLETTYDGTGSFMRNNIIYGGFTGILHQQYEHYDAVGAKWTVENNIASTRGWMLGHGTRVDPSNIFVDEAVSAGTLPSNFWDADAFVNPDYTEPNSKFCGPEGSDDCDWTPKQGSILCTAGSGGGYVGAVPYNGTGVKVWRKLFDKLDLEPKIGPNPFTDHLSVKPAGEITLFTSEGKLIGTYNDPVVFSGNLEAGVYLVKAGNILQTMIKME